MTKDYMNMLYNIIVVFKNQDVWHDNGPKDKMLL